MYYVKDVMTEDVVVVRPHATIDEAISQMIDNRVSGLPVVDADRNLVGVITEIDIIDLVYEGDLSSTLVGDHMTKDVSALDITSSLDEAANIFCNNSIRRIPIVCDGRLVGVLSRHDLIGFVRAVRQKAVVA